MLTARNLLEAVAYFTDMGSTVPSSRLLATYLGIPGDEHSVWESLRDLERGGLIHGAPGTPRGWHKYIRLSNAGREALGLPVAKRARVVSVVRATKCSDCGADTLDASKACPMCRLSWSMDLAQPVWFEPNQGAA